MRFWGGLQSWKKQSPQKLPSGAPPLKITSALLLLPIQLQRCFHLPLQCEAWYGSRSPRSSWDSHFFSIGPPLKIISLQGVPSCSPLPSPTLKWQVIAPLQLCRKEQEGTCDFEVGLQRGKKVFLGTLGTLLLFKLWSPPQNNSVLFQLWQKNEFFWMLKKLVILRGAPVQKVTL